MVGKPATPPSQPPNGAALSFRDRLHRWRTKLIANPKVRRRLERLPFLNRIANRKSRELFDLTTGFVHAQVVFACVQIDLFRSLAQGPRTTAEIAAGAGLNDRAADLLLTAAAELDLIRQGRAGAWLLADFGAVIAADRGIADMIEHHAMLYRDLADPLALLRGETEVTETAAFWSYAGSSGDDVTEGEADSYSRLMAHSLNFVIEQVFDAYPVTRHNIVLDIGGGSGAFLEAVGRHNPQAQLWLYDLPAVAPQARDRFARAGMADQVEIHGGDFFTDPLPAGADLVTLIRIVCDHDDDRVLALLKNVRAALSGESRLLIAEAMSGPEGGAGRAAAYFSFYFLAMKSGRCRSPAQLSDLLRQAGFSTIEKHKTRQPIFASVIVAHP